MTFNVYVISYNRYDRIVTQRYVEYCTYVVRKSQYDLYVNGGAENVICVEDDLIDSADKVRNWLIENAPEDVIAILDDDLYGFRYRLEEYEKIADPVLASIEIERLAQLVADLDIGFGSGPGHTNLIYYDRPFRFVGIVNGVKIFNVKKLRKTGSRFDDRYRFLSDDDFVLQELMKSRVILLNDYFLAISGINTNTGGNDYEKSQKAIEKDNQMMKERWGKYYKMPTKKRLGSLAVKR